MAFHHLEATEDATIGRVDARAEGDGWTASSSAVLDVRPVRGEGSVELGFEHDPDDLDGLDHADEADGLRDHADLATLTPREARTLAATLLDAARAAERTPRCSDSEADPASDSGVAAGRGD